MNKCWEGCMDYHIQKISEYFSPAYAVAVWTLILIGIEISVVRLLLSVTRHVAEHSFKYSGKSNFYNLV